MIPYSALAQVYDQLTGDVAYRQWAEFAQRAFERQGKGETKVILELACGTGSLTQLLAQAGYEMIAADISPEMLSVAREKCASAPCPPIFLCQDMRELDLYGDIDAAVCCLDSVNYLTGLRDLKRAFRRVALFLRPGGLFLFDVKTPLAFAEMGGLSSIQQVGEAFCAWQYGYEAKSGAAQHQVDIFWPEADGRYLRSTELHEQRAYSRQQLEQALAQAGLELVSVYASPEGRKASPKARRLYFAARKKAGETGAWKKPGGSWRTIAVSRESMR